VSGTSFPKKTYKSFEGEAKGETPFTSILSEKATEMFALRDASFPLIMTFIFQVNNGEEQEHGSGVA
jgi:hypothetical protein